MPHTAAAVAIAVTRLGVTGEIVQGFAANRPLFGAVGVDQTKIALRRGACFGHECGPGHQAAARAVAFVGGVFVKDVDGAPGGVGQHAVFHHGLCLCANVDECQQGCGQEGLLVVHHDQGSLQVVTGIRCR